MKTKNRYSGPTLSEPKLGCWEQERELPLKSLFSIEASSHLGSFGCSGHIGAVESLLTDYKCAKSPSAKQNKPYCIEITVTQIF